MDNKPIEILFREMIRELITKVRAEPNLSAISPDLIRELRESVIRFP